MREVMAWAVACIMLCEACGGGNRSATMDPPVPTKESKVDALRFLTQATFGLTSDDLNQAADLDPSAWIDTQLALPVQRKCLNYMSARAPQLSADPRGNFALGDDQFYEFFYLTAATAPDQLRQRLVFALSQIFVVSFLNGPIYGRPLTAGSYWDMLEADAFGNFRKLLEDVTLHPAMGMYLSTIFNLPEDPFTGRLPDENYAREVLQLMAIGLNRLNPDGSLQLDPLGNPIPTYTHDDVAGLAKVFTGFGWYAPFPTDQTFWVGVGTESDTSPMTLYPDYHSTSSKTFLGTTLAATSTSDPAGDVKAALDTIFNHPNVGPFLARGLIQQLVTSNPSQNYVGRVAAAFEDNGRGIRGDLSSVIRAVLLDSEARTPPGPQEYAFGKLKEPVLRLTEWIRAFHVSSQSGNFLVGNTDPEASALGQSPLTAPSVFNFWVPTYHPPLIGFVGSNLVAPEFQIVDEVSVAGYLNFIMDTVATGCGGGPSTSPATMGPDLYSTYTEELALASDTQALVDRLEQLLLCGTMSSALRAATSSATDSVALPSIADSQAFQTALLNRVKVAVFLVLASPEFLHQR